MSTSTWITRLCHMFATTILCMASTSAQAAKLQFVQPTYAGWGVQLGSTSRTGAKPLGYYFSGDLYTIRPAGSPVARVSMFHEVYGNQYATLNLGGSAYADSRMTPGYGRVVTTTSNLNSWTYLPVKILPTYGESNGKSVRVTLNGYYYGGKSGTGSSWNRAMLFYARPGDRTGTSMINITNNYSTTSRSDSRIFDARIGDTFYVASYYEFYCPANTSNNGELRLEMRVQ